MSTTHIAHESEEDMLEDGCPRCKEHASNPLGELDDRMLTALMERIVHRKEGRSEVEREAMKNVELAMGSAGMLFSAAPDYMVQFMNARWGIRVSVQ